VSDQESGSYDKLSIASSYREVDSAEERIAIAFVFTPSTTFIPVNLLCHLAGDRGYASRDQRRRAGVGGEQTIESHSMKYICIFQSINRCIEYVGIVR
jgi:hypothetical protein